MKILSPIIIILMLIPVLGININTHICGKSQNTLNSIVIPGLLEADECNKCHKVVVVKSCCSNEGPDNTTQIQYKENKKGCCKDFLTYKSYDYFVNNKLLAHNSISLTLSLVKTYQILNLDSWPKTLLNYKRVRLRPYQIDIIPLTCSYLI
jgi:hypothetical protein